MLEQNVGKTLGDAADDTISEVSEASVTEAIETENEDTASTFTEEYVYEEDGAEEVKETELDFEIIVEEEEEKSKLGEVMKELFSESATMGVGEAVTTGVIALHNWADREIHQREAFIYQQREGYRNLGTPEEEYAKSSASRWPNWEMGKEGFRTTPSITQATVWGVTDGKKRSIYEAPEYDKTRLEVLFAGGYDWGNFHQFERDLSLQAVLLFECNRH